ncbi:pierisin-like, partial [Contarinia nasturtii]|uniref:pierisin-like n=1 Tax=Contarinia nasturtii TaxID=265458 RepID=UPI0012D47C75
LSSKELYYDVAHAVTTQILIVCVLFSIVFSPDNVVQVLFDPDKTNGAKAAALNWIRELAIEIVTLYMARSWGDDLPAESEPTWRPRRVVDLDGQTRSDRRQRLIRWDRRGPNEIFHHGFIPHVTNERPSFEETNLFSYAQSNVSSFFVSTSKTRFYQNGTRRDVWTPRTSRINTIYQYEIYAPGGIDVNESFGNRSPWPNQEEVAFPGGIRRRYVRSVREFRDGRIRRVWINSGFSNLTGLTPIRTQRKTPQILWKGKHPDGDNQDPSTLVNQNPDHDMAGSNGEVIEDTFENEEHPRIIPDGEYKIASSINRNVVADLSPGADSPVHAWQCFGLNNQKWNFIYDDDKKAYIITSSEDPKIALTWWTQDGRAVGWTFVNELTQYWRVERTEDGYDKLNSLHDLTRVLDLDRAETSNGNKIVLNQEHPGNTPNQKWIISPIYHGTVQDGEYKIASSINRNVVADLSPGADSSVHAWQCFGLNNQKWNFIYDDDKKAYIITSSEDPKIALTWWTQDGRAVGWTFVNELTQYWRVERTEDGYYKLKTLHDPTKVLDLTGAETSNGNKIVLYQEHPDNTPHQKWIISPISYQTVPDGDYKIATSMDENVIADLSNDGDRSVHAWQYVGLNNQKWNFHYDNNKKAYKIISCKDSKIALTWCTEDGRAVGWAFSSLLTQYWRIERTEDGYYKLKSLNDPSKVLDMARAETSNGNKIVLYQENPDNTPHQKWALARINTAIVPNGEYRIATKIMHTKVIDFVAVTFNLMITDNFNLVTSYWRLEYDTTKNAYKIFTKKYVHSGFYFQNSNSDLKVDKIDNSSDLRSYWTIEYNVRRGGYLIRSLHTPTQVLDLKNSGITHGTPIVSYSVNNYNNQLWNLIPS